MENLGRDLDRAVPIREFIVAHPWLALGASAVAAAVATRFVSVPTHLLLRTARSLAVHRFMSELSQEA